MKISKLKIINKKKPTQRIIEVPFTIETNSEVVGNFNGSKYGIEMIKHRQNYYLVH
jgi:hypothetical protein